MSSQKENNNNEYKAVNVYPNNRGTSADSITSHPSKENVAINVNDDVKIKGNIETKVMIKTIPNDQDKDSWKKHIPFIYWIPKYSFKDLFIADLIGALTGCIMVIPQGMGYALTAGLDARYGLYSGLFGPLLYWPFGTAGQIIVAPMAVVSLMTMQSINENITNEDDIIEAAAIASTIAFQAGLILFVLGLLQGGVLASMLSKPVLIGFKSGAGILIALSQMKFIFNVYVQGGGFLVMIKSLFQNISNTHINSLLLSIGSIAFLLTFRTLKKTFNTQKYESKCKNIMVILIKYFPSELIMVIIGILIVYFSENAGFDSIGDIPKGLPPFKNFLKLIPSKLFWNSGMWLTSFLIAILCFIESFVGGQKYADKLEYNIDASQELIALGISNIVMSWFQCFISGGALSRTVVVGESGALTPLTGLLCGIFMIVAILLLLPVFALIPKPVLGSIVVVGVLGLFDFAGMKHLWKINKGDFVVMCSTIVVTLLLGIDIGVGTGVILSILIFLKHSAKPKYSILGRITRYDEYYHYSSDEDDPQGRTNKFKKDHYYIYKDIKYNKDAKLRRDMLMIRWEAPLFFGNFNSFKSRISKHIYRFLLKNNLFLNDNINGEFCLVLSFESVTDIDTTAIDLLYNLVQEWKKKYKIFIVISRIKKHIYKTFVKHEEILKVIGTDNVTSASLYDCEKMWNKHLVTHYPGFFKKGIKIVMNPAKARYNTPSIGDDQRDVMINMQTPRTKDDSVLFNNIYKSESELGGNNTNNPSNKNTLYSNPQQSGSTGSLNDMETNPETQTTNENASLLTHGYVPKIIEEGGNKTTMNQLYNKPN